MKIHVRIPGGEAHTIDATCITEALRIFYRGPEPILLEAKWSGWKNWAVYNVRTEIVVTRLET